uniref:Fatty acid desaturase n=1 Tax=uncultured bacterium CSLF42 TaxID=1091574 RepID=G4WVX6_9BACT|nr:fatty acid desaturase [uncultured bacterium CSLF42]
MMAPESFDSFADVRRTVEDLFRVRPGLYWLDFSLCMGMGWGSLYLSLQTPWHSWLVRLAWTLLSTLSFFRGILFIHEMAHIRTEDLPAFRWAWNAFCGFFFFLPDYTYIAHTYHHRPATFSTREDPEYVSVAYQKPLEILSPFLVFPMLPLLMAIRFLIVGPISLLVQGSFRDGLLRYASTLKMNPRFEWREISDRHRRLSVWQDLLCFLWWCAFIVVLGRMGGVSIFLQIYLVMYGVAVVNHVRSLASHRYENAAGERLSFEAQILDSITITDFSPLAVLFMPIGLRYHSVHHMFPSLPYHSLRRAHERLIGSLPEDHVYRKTLFPSFSAALSHLFQRVISHRISSN